MKKMRTILILALVASPGILLSGRAAVSQQTAGELFEKALYVEEGQGDLQKAIEIYQDLLKRFPENREIAAKAQLHIGLCFEKLGAKEAEKAFQKVVDNYPEQSEAVRQAKGKLAARLTARSIVTRGIADFQIRKIGSLEVLGAPSPDGRLISCIDWDTGDLALFEVDSGKKHRITNKGSWSVSSDFAEESIFSPDGKTIAYNWYNYKNLRYDLRRINIDGTGQKDLLSDEDLDYIWPCDWTPDGKHILAIVTDKEKRSRIASISALDGTVRTIREFTSGMPGKLRLSPDGQWLAFAYPQGVAGRGSSEKSDIYFLAMDGSREVSIIVHPAGDCLLGWSPDGRSILFSSDRSGTWDAWILPVKNGAAAGDPRLVKRDFGASKIIPMGFTKDGAFYYGVRVSQDDVYLVSLDPATGGPVGQAEKAALRFEGSNAYPFWSPDGSLLAYTSFRSPDRSEPGVLCTKSMISGEEREFYPRFHSFNTVAWFPDGKSVLIRGFDEDHRAGLYRMDLVKGDHTTLLVLDDTAGFHGPVLSSDGKRIIYDVDELKNDIFRIMSYDLATGEKKEIIRGLHQFLHFDLSPDGRWLIYGDEEDGVASLKRMPSEGGEKQILLKLSTGGGINSVACSPDGRSIYFSKWEKGSSKSEAASLWRIPAEGGEPVRFDLTMDGLENLSFRPDGKKLAFNSWRIEAEVWVMENFLGGGKK